jgi:hypothetical protein
MKRCTMYSTQVQKETPSSHEKAAAGAFVLSAWTAAALARTVYTTVGG